MRQLLLTLLLCHGRHLLSAAFSVGSQGKRLPTSFREVVRVQVPPRSAVEVPYFAHSFADGTSSTASAARLSPTTAVSTLSIIGLVTMFRFSWKYNEKGRKKGPKQYGLIKMAQVSKKNYKDHRNMESKWHAQWGCQRDRNGHRRKNGAYYKGQKNGQRSEWSLTKGPQDLWFRDNRGARDPIAPTYYWSKPTNPQDHVWRYHVKNIYKIFRFQPGRPPRTENGESIPYNLDHRDITLQRRGFPLWATKTDSEVLSDLDPQKSIVRKVNETAEMLTPALWNKPAFRAAALLLSSAAVGKVLPFAGYLHVLAFSAWLGTNFWTTFIAGITMFKSLPKQQFGKLQAKLFPKYFQLGTICTCVMLFTSVRLGLPTGPTIASLLCTLVNLLYTEPKSTEVMFQRYELDNSGEDNPELQKQLKSKFSKLHGASSLFNLGALVGLFAHGAMLAARI